MLSKMVNSIYSHSLDSYALITQFESVRISAVPKRPKVTKASDLQCCYTPLTGVLPIQYPGGGSSKSPILNGGFHNGVCWSCRSCWSSCTNRKGKVPQWHIMQITSSIIFGIPHHAHFFVVITNVRSKKREKKIFGNTGLRKKFQKTRDIDMYWQEDCLEKIKWERQSEKIFLRWKNFWEKVTKRYFRKGEVESWAPKWVSDVKGIIVHLFWV
jgi:hypothetical protein